MNRSEFSSIIHRPDGLDEPDEPQSPDGAHGSDGYQGGQEPPRPRGPQRSWGPLAPLGPVPTKYKPILDTTQSLPLTPTSRSLTSVR